MAFLIVMLTQKQGRPLIIVDFEHSVFAERGEKDVIRGTTLKGETTVCKSTYYILQILITVGLVKSSERLYMCFYKQSKSCNKNTYIFFTNL